MTEQAVVTGYDIIGDVHGCAASLRLLLQRLGYSEVDGAYQYFGGSSKDALNSRQVVFVGDIIDRGPRIREALQIVHAMVRVGSAQMILGNHEYNAVAYSMPLHNAPDEGAPHFVREHTVRHTHQIHETLEQYADHQDEWLRMLDWFLTLPVFLELSHCRVVHACWDQRLIDTLLQRRGNAHIDADFVQASADRHGFERMVIDRLTRGLDLQLPNGAAIAGRDGFTRRMFRAKFWADNPQIYEELAFQPDPLPADVAGLPISDDDRGKLLYYGSDAKPLFVGHYWRQGTPRPLRHNLACLDYSAVHRGRLVAYRMDDERDLDTDKFVWVDAVD